MTRDPENPESLLTARFARWGQRIVATGTKLSSDSAVSSAGVTIHRTPAAAWYGWGVTASVGKTRRVEPVASSRRVASYATGNGPVAGGNVASASATVSAPEVRLTPLARSRSKLAG